MPSPIRDNPPRTDDDRTFNRDTQNVARDRECNPPLRQLRGLARGGRLAVTSELYVASADLDMQRRMDESLPAMGFERSAIERFLYHEARLMDNHRYDDWHALWAEDGQVTYWVPCNDDAIDPKSNVSIIYDTRTQLRNRITRLRETLWLREQAPRLRRVVSNVEIEHETPAEVTVSSNFILAQLHRHNQYLWAGSSIHKLVPAGDSFKIRSKKVVLINNNEPMPNLMFLI
jgi:3-phenylpropionate/cinnamic acid dioxygenase small subunit